MQSIFSRGLPTSNTGRPTRSNSQGTPPSTTSKDGYIFPIIDDEKEKSYTTKDYTFKKFREFLNKWLKVVGKELGLCFDLYAYVFRHTAITVAIDHGLSVSYAANAAGTSVEMVQQHYYNGECQQNREKLTEAFMMAGE